MTLDHADLVDGSLVAGREPSFVPTPDADSAPFWQGLLDGELLVQRCTNCRRLRWPARCLCNRCYSEETEWIALSGRGRIFSWAISHHPFMAAYKEVVPFAIVYVAVSEQDDIVIPGNLTGPAEGLACDVPVRAVFGPEHGNVTFLTWRIEDSGER